MSLPTMRRLILHSVTFKKFWAHYYFFNDPRFLSRLEERGYRLVLSEGVTLEEGDYLLFMEATSVGLERFGLNNRLKDTVKRLLSRAMPLRDLYSEARRLGLGARIVVILLEGEMWLPANFDPALHDMFAAVMTWDDDLADGRRYHKFRLGQPIEWPAIENVPFKDRKLLINISGNKYSRHVSELYSERRRAIQYFETHWPEQFDLYGVGWNAPATRPQRLLPFMTPRYASYRGTVAQKADVFPKYRFALCYENAAVPGWVTEKMLDAIRSGCVPIYLGAPNIADYVDTDAFIDRQRFGSDRELGEFLMRMDEATHGRHTAAGADYLAGPNFRRFLVPSFADRIADVMDGLPAMSADSSICVSAAS